MKKFTASSFFWILGAVIIVFAAVRAIKPASKGALPVLGQAGAFHLTERGGKTVRLEDLQGSVWIGDFIFTRCAGICPIMTGHMKRLQEKLKDPGIRFVSFSVDPEYDTPQKLAEYADKAGADKDKWMFLTGDKKTIFDLSLQHFHLGVGDIPEAERPAPDQTVTHSSRFVLVDKKGKIRGYYEGSDPAKMDQLVRDARALLKE